MKPLAGCFRSLRAYSFTVVAGVLWLVWAGFVPGLGATQEDWADSVAPALVTPGPVPAEALAAQAVSSYDAVAEASAGPAAVGPIAPAPGQPAGALSGRIVFTSGGHGWVYTTGWVLQRGIQYEMNEDYGNVDQAAMFVFYCFNAGATVVPLRSVGHQTNEVVLDNVSAGVTFSGAWTTVTSDPVYYGSLGSGFRQASASVAETATATYTPTIPVAGFYPVYGWAPHGANRTNQLYRIRHTGGESQVRVPHHMVGNGWVYLGTYYFNAGSNSANGAVIVSNLQPGALAGSVVIADAIRFGNGMSSAGSGYPREEEGARYWVQNSLGQGQSSSIYLSPGDTPDVEDRKARPKMASEMNREQSGAKTKRLYISFHSNAFNGNARGTVALYNNTNATPNQVWFATVMGQEVTADMVSLNAQLEFPWYNRGSGILLGGPYVEIGDLYLGSEMDATLLEVAFHDNASDAALMRDPKVRNWVARGAYHAVVRYMNQFDGGALNYLPEPPYNVRAEAVPTGIRVSWNTPIGQAGSGVPTGYVVYVSTDGYGFGSPVAVNGGGATSTTLTSLPADADFYFRVAAVNPGGESFPSEVAGCRRTSNPAQSRVLFVNAFDRFDRTANLRQTPAALNYIPPGNSGTMQRVLPRANNSFDYVAQHGKAVGAFGMPIDSCSRQAVTSGQVSLSNYDIVLWECGTSLTNTFRALEHNVITNFQNAGGHLFVSGADIAWDLDRASGPSAADRAFLNAALHADLGADANNNSGSYTVTPAGGAIFSGSGNATFDDGTKGIYWVQNPDALTPVGPGASAALTYVGGSAGSAAVQYDGSAGGGKVVYLGFPFETITSPAARNAYMAEILRFFSKPAQLEAIAWLPGQRPLLTLGAEPGLTYTILASSNLTSWAPLTNLLNVSGSVSFVDDAATNAPQRFYRAELLP